MGRVTLVAALVLLIATSAALAAPPWSAPGSVSPASLFVDDPQVVFDTGGRAYATWRWTNGTGPSATGGRRIAVREPGAAEFGAERSAPNFVTPLLTHGVDRVLGLDERRRSRGRVSLRARFSRPDGSFGRPHTISTHVAAGSPSLAVHGDALVAWTQQGSRGRRIVRTAIRRGGRFGRPRTLRGRGRSRDVVAAFGQGVLFVAWERAGVVEARVRRVGRGWGPVRRIGSAAKGSNTFRAMFNGRRGYLVWLAETGETAVLRTAILPVAGTRFRAPRTVDMIERDPSVEPHGPEIVAVPDREALLAWTDFDGAVWRVRAAATGPQATFGPPADVSPPGEQAVLGGAAVSSQAAGTAAGSVMVLWSRLDAVGELGDRVRASVRPPGGQFGGPEDVSDLDRARLPDVAFDPIGNRWTSVWSQRIGPDQGVPLNQITTFLRSSTRPG
jgi:hypothetical protein